MSLVGQRVKRLQKKPHKHMRSEYLWKIFMKMSSPHTKFLVYNGKGGGDGRKVFRNDKQ